MQYAPVNHDPSGAASVFAPPLDYTRKRNHDMMTGPPMFEHGHQELQDFATGHRGTNTVTGFTAQGLHGTRVLQSPPHIQPPRDTFDNMPPNPSIDR